MNPGTYIWEDMTHEQRDRRWKESTQKYMDKQERDRALQLVLGVVLGGSRDAAERLLKEVVEGARLQGLSENPQTRGSLRDA